MRYLEFHLVFMLPALVAAALAARGWRARLGPRAAWGLPVIAGIAFLYTTPWDNHLVRSGIWSYGPDRVLATIGWVPVEEYLFFLLQPILTGLWLYRVIPAAGGAGSAGRPRAGTPDETGNVAIHRRHAHSPGRPGATCPAPDAAAGSHRAVRAAGVVFWLAVTAAGLWALRRPAGTYLGLILVWAAPVLAAQWAYAGPEIWRRRGAWVAGVVIPTVYLWFADAVAIRLGIWTIAPETRTGIEPFGLPIEEAAFFLLTNVLVVQGLILFLYPPGRGAPAETPPDPGARAAPAR